MRHIDVPIDLTLLDAEDLEWIRHTGDTITEPAWTIRPYKLTDSDMTRIQPILDQVPVQPDYVAIIMVPAGTACKTHVDDIGGRFSALNIGIQIDNTKSFFEYMDGDTVLERVTLETPKLWAVDLPHRVDNIAYERNRVVLSLGYKQKIDDLYDLFH